MKNIKVKTILTRTMLIFILQSCGGGSSNEPSIEIPESGTNPPLLTEPALYKTPVGSNYLPLPQHSPEFDQNQYQTMRNEIYFISNRGNYQGDGDKDSMYMHSGLDIYMVNGTPIYVIADGIVGKTDRRTDGFKSVLIEDSLNQDSGWDYVHIDEFYVTEGDPVFQGQLLGVSKFNGTEHMHLARVSRIENNSWDQGYYAEYPDKYFDFIDQQAPVLSDEIYFMANQTDTILSINDENAISGEVDIVVGIRDLGKYATHPDVYYLAARVIPVKLGFEIESEAGDVVMSSQFDFQSMVITKSNSQSSFGNEQARNLYKSPNLFLNQPWYEIGNSYIVLTHLQKTSSDTSFPIIFDDSFDSLNWNTSTYNNDGSPQFPNGRYKITVYAEDSRANKVIKEYWVDVLN
ncbi:MAG: M23 family metallopeptidase [Colwellia sp.]|nr:M23 family metallopeptidase [Colwellia sp.]